MHKRIMDEIRENLASKSNDELLRIWKENDREKWSSTAFEAIRQILTERGFELPNQVQPEPDEEELEYLGTLPSTSGFPCMRCGKTHRSLRYRKLKVGIGFTYWLTEWKWSGYICNPCAVLGTVATFGGGVLSIFLIHPQAFYWAPVFLCQNLWNLLRGAKPETPFALSASDIERGVITDTPVQRLVGLAQGISEEQKYIHSAILLGVIPILCGYREETFVIEVQERLQQCKDTRFASFWKRIIKKSILEAEKHQHTNATP